MHYEMIIAGFGSAAYRDMLALRHRVLREPLGLAFTAAQLASEAGQLHLALLGRDAVIGTALLVPPDRDGTGTLRQMAVDPRLARQGCGAALLRRAEREFARLGAARVDLASRLTAVGFYQRFGYATRGCVFEEVTIPHVRMRKALRADTLAPS